jgi:hypothetical protein
VPRSMEGDTPPLLLPPLLPPLLVWRTLPHTSTTMQCPCVFCCAAMPPPPEGGDPDLTPPPRIAKARAFASRVEEGVRSWRSKARFTENTAVEEEE